MSASSPHYQRPGWFTKNVFNRIVASATRAGLSVWGSRILRVRGRKSGQWRSTPVNLLSLGTERYLVAARGDTEWVRNLRTAGQGELQVGRRIATFRARELPDDQKVPILRAYLLRWKAEVGVFFRWRRRPVTRAGSASDRAAASGLPGHPDVTAAAPGPARAGRR